MQSWKWCKETEINLSIYRSLTKRPRGLLSEDRRWRWCDNVFYRHSPSNELAFVNEIQEHGKGLLFLLCMCRLWARGCINLHIFLAHTCLLDLNICADYKRHCVYLSAFGHEDAPTPLSWRRKDVQGWHLSAWQACPAWDCGPGRAAGFGVSDMGWLGESRFFYWKKSLSCTSAPHSDKCNAGLKKVSWPSLHPSPSHYRAEILSWYSVTGTRQTTVATLFLVWKCAMWAGCHSPSHLARLSLRLTCFLS